MNYNQILNYIYETYIQVKPQIAGLSDDKARNPNTLVDLMNKLEIVPPQNKIIKITGSKGKGTTTRICENMIRAYAPTANVAMLISPEELEHNDRMRINNIPITTEEFENIFNELKPHLENIKQSPDFTYLSPSGLFALIAFKWWANKDIDYFVLETGRGAKYDEVGIIPSYISIVSSILLEHPKQLGGSLDSIAEHKLSVCNNCNYAVLDKTAIPYYQGYSAELLQNETPIKIDNFPKWYGNNCELATPAVSKLLNKSQNEITNAFINYPDKTSASFGYKQIDDKKYYFEPAVSVKSLDIEFIKSMANGKTLFLCSLPDDKDIDNMVNTLQQFGDVKHIVLTGTRGYLDYKTTENEYADDIIWTGEYNDIAGFEKLVTGLDYTNIYMIGTQTYIRLIKQAIF